MTFKNITIKTANVKHVSTFGNLQHTNCSKPKKKWGLIFNKIQAVFGSVKYLK